MIRMAAFKLDKWKVHCWLPWESKIMHLGIFEQYTFISRASSLQFELGVNLVQSWISLFLNLLSDLFSNYLAINSIRCLLISSFTKGAAFR